MPAMLLEAPPSALDVQHHVRFGFGAGVDPRHHAAFEQRFAFPLLEAWAMTETGAAACIMAHREPRHVGTRCFGRAEAFVETRIVDDKGFETEPGLAGELLVRAAGADPRRDFFLGYLKDDSATSEAWAGGWFHTGDVVRRSAEGDFHFVDRRKNVIRRSGENISAVEVESVLNQHPAVEASAVAPTPDPVRGDEVLACIVLRQAPMLPPREQIAHSIVRYTLDRLAYFKAPGYVAFVDTLPLTPSQKVQRGELRELARRLPGSPACFDVRMLKRRKKRLGAAATAAGGLALSGPGSLASPTEHGLSTPSAAGGLGRGTSGGGLGPAGGPVDTSFQDALSGIVLPEPSGDAAGARRRRPRRWAGTCAGRTWARVDAGGTGGRRFPQRRQPARRRRSLTWRARPTRASRSPGAGHGALPALLDARRALVHRRRHGRTGRALRHRQGSDRRPHRQQLLAVARHRGRRHPASRRQPALARPHPDRRRLRRDGAATAARAVQARDAEVVACIAADANHVESFRQMLGGFSHFARDASYPYGSGGPNSIFAFITAHYMASFGATREDFGRICVAQRANALKNPNALFKVPLTMAQYLDARPISDPIHLFDCVMPCAGAEAFLVMSEERARDLGLAHVLMRGAIERHNAFADDPILLRGGWLVDRDDLYAQAGVGPEAIDFVQTYDDYPVVVMLQFEDLGFCAKGDGKEFVRARTLTHDGDFPNNTGGGQLSAGQAGCAGGFLGMTEAIRQLTDRGR
jgi:hypothetical protein